GKPNSCGRAPNVARMGVPAPPGRARPGERETKRRKRNLAEV
ncbi:MAG: hypothetical protein AVDCRST_MAG64-3067, partial [uncultured Phycisphaerae bacterium]